MKTEEKKSDTKKSKDDLKIKGTGKCTICSCSAFSASDDDPDMCTCGHLDYQHKK